ncbi:uncharacterized protein L201_004077 [Kwoniella dendrophila CBS 6074]|uniref:Peptidase M48 domain-containing protein n=1 Tax=Kwoniella dendrophila CBS 6074 TaxID=1295534 RepID=A0AAX4JV32_9TREE
MFTIRRPRISRSFSRVVIQANPIVPTPFLPTSTASFSSVSISSTPVASSSKTPYRSRPYGSKPDVKGKGRAIEDDLPQTFASLRNTRFLLNNTQNQYGQRLSVQRRRFHATQRRDAIPLLPASIAILKGTSILTAATAVSRIIISFLPIGTIAAFRMASAGKWLEREGTEPEVSEEAREFWKMWCEGEKWIPLTKEDAESFWDSDYDDEKLNGGMMNAKGQIAYPVPFPSRFSKRRHRAQIKNEFSNQNGKKNNEINAMSPKALREMHNDKSKNHVLSWIRRGNFFIPELPSASLNQWQNTLNEKERLQVNSLRRYWIGLKVFKNWYKKSRWLMGVIFGLPFLILTSVYLAGLERVPLTGRMRLILLTPEEEDQISISLSGTNWFKSVINLLTTAEKPAPPIVNPNDWRWVWVQNTLSNLEKGILRECSLNTNVTIDGSGTFSLDGKQAPISKDLIDSTNNTSNLVIIPPPAGHPIKPRPRVSSLLHSCLPGAVENSGKEHLEIGPPYNLMLMDKNEENAFSYGFGGKRAGGIVVFTGLLDSILREKPSSPQNEPSVTASSSASKGLFSFLFSSGSSTSVTRRNPTQPTEEQTLQLACVLAHEMGHLLLSHHLETLSQQQVLWPSVLGLSMDLIRAFIWPFTWILGPTVNDALANMGRTSTDELADKYGEIGFQFVHEYEADLAGLRILALAGYDPYKALTYFSTSVAELHEIKPIDKDKNKKDNSWTGSLFKLWTRKTHPTPEKRLEAIKDELDRWEKERELSENKKNEIDI